MSRAFTTLLRPTPQRTSAHARKLTTQGSMHIIGISGSIRKGSYNTLLLKAAQKVLPPGVTMDVAQIDDLPLINTDLEEDTEGGTRFPQPVERFRKAVFEADAVLFGNPEYNFSLSAPMKNAIDWASRPKPKNAWQGKPAAMVSIAGGYAGINGQQAMRAVNGFIDMQVSNILNIFLDVQLLTNPRLTLSLKDGPFFDEQTGQLLDPKLEARLKSVVEALVDWAAFLQTRGK